MARIETDLIVRAIHEGFDRLQGEIREVGDVARRTGDAVEGSGDGAGRAGLRWTELASQVGLAQQAYQTISGAISTAMDALEQGAELELAANRFDRLAASIGETGDALLTDLRGATAGMVSDAELMASASDIMRLGLADTGEGVIELATLISELGLDMQQVIMTFANDSVMRLDALGLSVETVTNRADELAATGIDMTEAFDLAVIEGLKEQLDLVGSAADTTAGDIRRLKADWENTKNEMMAAFAEEVDLKEVGSDVRDLTRDLAELTGVVLTLIGPLQDLQNIGEAIMNFPLSPPGFLKMLINLVRGGEDAEQAMSDAAVAAAAYEDNLRSISSDGQRAAEAQTALATATNEAAREIERASGPADEFSRKLEQLNRGVGVRITPEIDTDEARTQIDNFILEYEGRKVQFDIEPSGEDEPATLAERLFGSLQREMEERAQFEVRFQVAEMDQLEEQRLRQEFNNARETLFTPEASDFEIPVSPELDIDGLISQMEEGLIGVQDVIDMSPPHVEPEVDQSELEEMVRYIDGPVGQSIDGVFAEPHVLDTVDNLDELNTRLQGSLNLVNSISGTHHVNFVMSQSGGAPNPHTGPYDTGGAGANGGGQGGGQPGAPTPGFASPSNPVQILQDRGVLSPGLLR